MKSDMKYVKQFFIYMSILLSIALVIAGLELSGAFKNVYKKINEDYGGSDQLYSNSEEKVTLYVFRFGEEAIETDEYNSISFHPEQETRDGAFYKVVADITYLSGGFAGYMHYPEIDRIHSCTEISIDDLNLPSIENKRYGLTKIGDYADADYCLCASGNHAIYKDGKWLYSYDSDKDGENGTLILCNEDVTDEQIYDGIENGIICCEDYFIMPAIAE